MARAQVTYGWALWCVMCDLCVGTVRNIWPTTGMTGTYAELSAMAITSDVSPPHATTTSHNTTTYYTLMCVCVIR